MSEIKVGEFVRTKDGYIAKLIKIEQEPNVIGKTYFFDNNVLGDCDEWNLSEEYLENIIKNSPNIIDLIEVGDILELKNGEKWEVQEHQGNGNWLQLEWENIDDNEDFFKKVDSIVTKEQFSQMEYKVEE